MPAQWLAPRDEITQRYARGPRVRHLMQLGWAIFVLHGGRCVVRWLRLRPTSVTHTTSTYQFSLLLAMAQADLQCRPPSRRQLAGAASTWGFSTGPCNYECMVSGRLESSSTRMRSLFAWHTSVLQP